MTPRIDYPKANPNAFKVMMGLQTYVDKSGLAHSLLDLVKLRASQINSCAYCFDMRSKDAQARGETEQRLYALNAWRETPFYRRARRASADGGSDAARPFPVGSASGCRACPKVSSVEYRVMKLSKIVFVVAGLYGLATLVPTYFFEAQIGINDPPPVTHPEYFYGFLGVALAWQVMFFVIAFDPQRYRPVMFVAFLEKLCFGAAALALFAGHRIQSQVLALGLIDLFLGVLFLIAYATTERGLHSPRLTSHQGVRRGCD